MEVTKTNGYPLHFQTDKWFVQQKESDAEVAKAKTLSLCQKCTHIH